MSQILEYNFNKSAQIGSNTIQNNAPTQNAPSLNGTLINSPTLNSDGPTNLIKAVQLNASRSQYISVPPIYTTYSGLTFCCWVNVGNNKNGNWARIFDFANGQQLDNIVMAIYNNSLALSIYDGQINRFQPMNIYPIPNNTWFHVAWTLDVNNGWKIYINGNLLISYTGAYYPNTLNRTKQFIGKSNWNSDPYFSGSIADFRMYGAVLELSDIQNIYNIDETSTVYNQMYDQIFCDLIPKKNGFIQCQNCNYGTLSAYKTSTKNTETDCLNTCANNYPYCTSYNYNTTNQQCTENQAFPSTTNNNVPNINSGYSLRFQYDYTSLSPDQQKIAQKKCSNEFLKNTFNIPQKVDISGCLKIEDDKKNNNLTDFNVDPQCLYNVYQANGLKTNIVNKSNYIDKPQTSTSDSNIDNYKSSFDTYNKLQSQNSNINNNLQSTDSSYSTYNNTVDGQINNLKSSFQKNLLDIENSELGSIHDVTHNMGEIQKKNIESFENYESSNNHLKYLILAIIIIIICLILFYSFK
jgi:hypothetical protein